MRFFSLRKGDNVSKNYRKRTVRLKLSPKRIPNLNQSKHNIFFKNTITQSEKQWYIGFLGTK